jgi:hypothetical protein
MASGMLRVLLSSIAPTLIEKGIDYGSSFIRNFSDLLSKGSNFWQSLKSAGTNTLNRFLGIVDNNQVANRMPMMVTNQNQPRVMSRGIGINRMGGTAAGFPTYIPGVPQIEKGIMRPDFGGVPQSIRVPRLKRRMGVNNIFTKRGEKGAVSFKRYI